MNVTKNILGIIGILTALVLLMGTTSALTFGIPNSNHPLNSLTPNSDVQVLITNNDGMALDVTLTFSEIGFATINDLHTTIDGTETSTFTLADGQSKTVNVSLDRINDAIKFGTSSTAKLSATTTQGPSTAVTLEHYESFCRSGPKRQNILEINNVKISNEGDSEDGDDNEWYPFDDIEIEVEVENNGNDNDRNDDLNDLVIEIGLIGSNGRNIINDFEFASSDEEKEEIGDLDPDENEEHIFRMVLEESDEDFEGNFDFVVKVYERGKEDNVCVDFADDLEGANGFFESISLERESDENKFVRFKDIVISPEQVTCGETVEVKMDVVNVGDDTVENLEIILISDELGIDLRQVLRDDLDEGDEETVRLQFTLPNGLENKGHRALLTANYEVDDDQKTTDNDKQLVFNVLGCGASPTGTGTTNVLVVPSLASTPKQGEPLTVNVIVTNAGSETASTVLDATGFALWADSVSISERVLSLNSGQSTTVILIFDVKDEVSGAQTFNIETTSNGNLDIQQVEVNFASESDSPRVTGFAGLNLGGGGNLLWVIGIINLVLIILIIVVAVRLSRR